MEQQEVKTFEYKDKYAQNTDTDIVKAIAIKMAQDKKDNMVSALRVYLNGPVVINGVHRRKPMVWVC